MSQYPFTKLEDHDTGTVNVNAIINANWQQIDAILSNTGAGAGILAAAIGNASGGTQVGFQGRPQVVKSADYTLVAGDAGKHILHPAADTAARVWTVPANATVAFATGAEVAMNVEAGAGVISIAVAGGDVLEWANAGGGTGNRTLAGPGQAMLRKVTPTKWQIWGTNIT